MSALRILQMALLAVVFLWLTPGVPSLLGRPSRVLKPRGYLRRLYRALVVERKRSSAQEQQRPEMQWSNASLLVYFNLTNLHPATITMINGDLVLNKRHGSPMEFLYQQSYRIVITDANTNDIIFNRTVAARKGLHVMNLVRVIKRWQRYPRTNKGLHVTVRDTGMFERTLWTFYPRRNVSVPALAIFVREGNHFPRYKMLPSQSVRLLVNGLPVL